MLLVHHLKVDISRSAGAFARLGSGWSKIFGVIRISETYTDKAIGITRGGSWIGWVACGGFAGTWLTQGLTFIKSVAQILSRHISFCDIVAKRKSCFNTITLSITLAINPTLTLTQAVKNKTFV